jgi:hypothetical protein
MNGVGGQFLAGAALTFDQDIRRGRRDLPNRIEHFVQRGRFADDVLESEAFIHLLAQRPVLLLHPPARECPRDQHLNFVEVERFGDEIVGAALHRLHGRIDGTVSCHHDGDRRMRQL